MPSSSKSDPAAHAWQQCIACGQRFDLHEVLYACRTCGSLLDIAYDWSKLQIPRHLTYFEPRWSTPGRFKNGLADFSGVWRFRELLPFAALPDLVTVGEGRTILQQADQLAARLGHKPGRLFLQYEGFNPSGSFKDNGMAAAFTIARRLGKTRVGCASTGNTSAALALFARHTLTAEGKSMQAVVFVGGGKIAYGKLAQALDYGARTIQIDGDFDACMSLIQQAAERLGLYVMNSVNPFRLEGQKTIMYRVLEALNWEPPDWIVVPGGNLGNSSAFGKAFAELHELGLIRRIPRLAIINAAGANTLYELVNEHGLRFDNGKVDRTRVDAYYEQLAVDGRSAKTIASAIEIGRPVNLTKALRSLETMHGVVRQATDEEILDGKALVGAHGFGCEPASGASVAGLRQLLAEQVISPSDHVVCILTGHALKDPNVTVNYHSGEARPVGGASLRGTASDVARAAGANSASAVSEFANPPVRCPANLDAIGAALGAQT